MRDRVTIHGKGLTNVLVMHDWFCDCTCYAPALPYLNEDEFTYAFFDLRGYGKSIEIPGSYTCEEVTRDCLELVEELGWETFHIVGHSMTGFTIQHLNQAAEDRILSATAIAPVPATGSPIPEEFVSVIMQALNGDDAVAKEILNNATGNRYGDGFLDFKIRQFRKTATNAAREGYLNMFSKNDISDLVQGIKTPYYVIVGAKDSEWHGKEMMEQTFGKFFENCQITEIADASHYPMQETPPLFASHFEKFLKAHSKTSLHR